MKSTMRHSTSTDSPLTSKVALYILHSACPFTTLTEPILNRGMDRGARIEQCDQRKHGRPTSASANRTVASARMQRSSAAQAAPPQTAAHPPKKTTSGGTRYVIASPRMVAISNQPECRNC
jgi:hypothetical protein